MRVHVIIGLFFRCSLTWSYNVLTRSLLMSPKSLPTHLPLTTGENGSSTYGPSWNKSYDQRWCQPKVPQPELNQTGWWWGCFQTYVLRITTCYLYLQQPTTYNCPLPLFDLLLHNYSFSPHDAYYWLSTCCWILAQTWGARKDTLFGVNSESLRPKVQSWSPKACSLCGIKEVCKMTRVCHG